MRLAFQKNLSVISAMARHDIARHYSLQSVGDIVMSQIEKIYHKIRGVELQVKKIHEDYWNESQEIRFQDSSTELKDFRGHAEQHEGIHHPKRDLWHIPTATLLFCAVIAVFCIWKGRLILKRAMVRVQEEIHHLQ